MNNNSTEGETELTQRTSNEDSQLLNEGSQKISQKRKTPQQELDEKKEKLQKFIKWAKVKLEAGVWVLGSIYIIYYSNFFKVLFEHERVNELFFGIFMITIGINCAIALYVTIILPYIFKVKEDFDKYSPRVVYVGSISGVLCFFSLIICIWPVFKFWSPFMVFAFLMGYINTAHFLPNNQIGSLLFGAVFIGAFFSHLIIDHDGFLHSKDE